MISKQVYLLVFLAGLIPALAFAKAEQNPLSGGKHDSRAPVEVTSDSLEVLQQENKAVFSGHVVAIQGEVRLKADKMTVYYAKPDDKTAKKSEKTNEKSPANAIDKIDADGNVFLSTAMETASGTKGIYDVKKQEINLIGGVVLTRGQNVLKGDNLTYNFGTGKSILSAGTGSTPDGKGKERVRALFVPENNKK